jgi:hypothetical protein
MVLSAILVSIIFLPVKSCKKEPDEPIYTKLARMGGGFNVADTIAPKVDSTKIMNDFAKKLGDTATIAQFQRWMYKNVSAEVYESIMGSLNPYLQSYYRSRYQEFLNKKK